jgi:hypothetical protein
MNPVTENLARRLCAELKATVPPLRWQQVYDVAKRMGISPDNAERAAAFAAEKDWVNYQSHSVLLTEKGKTIIAPQASSRRVLKKRPPI